MSDTRSDLINVMHAMVGSVTANWRAVFAKHEGKTLLLTFVLERESAEDREEIADVAFEMETLQTDPNELKIAVVVGAAPLSTFVEAGQIVFARKE